MNPSTFETIARSRQQEINAAAAFAHLAEDPTLPVSSRRHRLTQLRLSLPLAALLRPAKSVITGTVAESPLLEQPSGPVID